VHIATGHSVSMLDCVRLLERAIGAKAKIRFVEPDPAFIRPAKILEFDTSTMQSIYGPTMTPVELGIGQMVKALRSAV
jgi:hypothetical protein